MIKIFLLLGVLLVSGCISVTINEQPNENVSDVTESGITFGNVVEVPNDSPCSGFDENTKFNQECSDYMNNLLG